jgi:hypothetical protein
MSISEAISHSYLSGNKPKVNINNKFTRRRMKLYENIKENTGENPDSELDYSRQIINENVPKVQRYIMSQNEQPSANLDDMIKQAYHLRCNQISAISSSLDIPDKDAQILIEEDENDANEIEANGKDEFLAELFAPIGIAATRLQMKQKRDSAEADNFVSPDLISGLIGTVGTKIGAADLKRAAANKPAGVLGFLGAGGTAHYDSLRAYFQKNPTIAQEVLSGQITDESQLPNWSNTMPTGANILNSNAITQSIADYQKKQALHKALPFIIGGVLVLVIVIILIARKRK